MPRGKRTRIAPGIYQDAVGLAACVTVGHAGPTRRSREKRFPLGTPIDVLQRWQVSTRRELRRAAPADVVTARGTLAAWAATYLASVTTMPSFEARRADLEAWLPTFGQRNPYSLTGPELATQLDRWRAQGYAASTLNHRRQALRAVFQVLAPGATPPIDGTQRQTPPPLEARAVPWSTVEEIVAALSPTKSGAMLRVMALTGLPPARIYRLTAGDFDPGARTLFLVGRRKGQGTVSKSIRVTSAAAAALQVWLLLFPEGGGVSKNSWIVEWHKTVGRVNALRAAEGRPPLPAGLRPYDLRHSYGTEVYQRTNDLKAAAEMLDVSLETAQRYTLGAVSAQVDKAVAAMDEGLPVARPRLVRGGQDGTA